MSTTLVPGAVSPAEEELRRTYPRDLGDGLQLRWAAPADLPHLIAFNTALHGDGPENPATDAGIWTGDLGGGKHPLVSVADFTLVEDLNQPEAGRPKIVSTLVLMSETWTYAGLPFGFGRPELVGTLPEYRRRGLVRAQMDAIHALGAVRGHLAQGITGIPWYYRQFGYEMTVNLSGSRAFFWQRGGNAKLKPAAAYTVRRATEADIPLLQELYGHATAHSLLRWERDDAVWRHLLSGLTPESATYTEYYLVFAGERPMGYYSLTERKGVFEVGEIGVLPGDSLRELGLFLVQHLLAQSKAKAGDDGDPRGWIMFKLGEAHPLYQALDRHLERQESTYAWYMRVPDLPAFLLRIAPVLEERLAGSVMAGYSGKLRLSFYRAALELVFAQGKLTAVQPYEQSNFWDSDAFFPELTFLHLLFCHRTVTEINHIRKDCYASKAEAALLLEILFPKQLAYICASA